MQAYNFFICGQKFTKFFCAQCGGFSWSTAFPIFDMSICSGDIRDQSEVVRNHATFFALPNLGDGPSKSYTHVITPASWHVA